MSHAPWPSSAFRTVALTAVCLLVSACATGPTAPRPVFIPDFTFVWQNQADSTNRYNLNTDQFDVESGVLEGEEEKVLNGDTRVTFSPLEGRFDGRSLDFTVDRDDSDTMVDCDDGEGYLRDVQRQFP